jgi:hypothetical protein
MSRFPQKWFDALLPDPDEYKVAPYLESSDGKNFVCLLCSTSVMSGIEVVRTHCSGKKHINRYRIFQVECEWELRRRLEPLQRSFTLRPRIQALRLEKWKWHVSHMLLRFLESGSDVDLNRAEEILFKYELMEKLSLLELAVWKQHILGRTFRTIQEARDFWLMDESFEAREYFVQQRVTSGVAVIVPIVLSFLGAQ